VTFDKLNSTFHAFSHILHAQNIYMHHNRESPVWRRIIRRFKCVCLQIRLATHVLLSLFHVRVHRYTYANTFTHAHTYTHCKRHVYIYIFHVYIYIYIYIYLHTDSLYKQHIYIYMYIYTYICMSIYMYIYYQNTHTQIKHARYDFPSPYWDCVSSEAKSLVGLTCSWMHVVRIWSPDFLSPYIEVCFLRGQVVGRS
jgi:hypothetical protein